MNIHCPMCGKAFEPGAGSDPNMLTCPSCGAAFNLAARETVRISEEATGGLGPDAGSDEPESALGNGTVFAGYRILEEVGRGGMGIVYRAVQLSLDRVVAIKVLPSKLGRDPQFVERFGREAKTLAMLNHPNIVSIIDKGVSGGLYYFVMEWIDGLSLRHVMKEGGLKPEQALKIIPEICAALEYAHFMKIVHRDIKPENILINTKGQVKIADFGLSKIVTGHAPAGGLTRTNMTMGTFNYMAPEQMEKARDVDHRADLFSLGVVFYEMLTGELPLGRFEPPSRKNIEIDLRLDEVVLKVLEKDPERRYQNAADISDAVMRISTSTGGRRRIQTQIPARAIHPSEVRGAAASGSGGNPWAIVSMVLGIISVLSLPCMCPLLFVLKPGVQRMDGNRMIMPAPVTPAQKAVPPVFRPWEEKRAPEGAKQAPEGESKKHSPPEDSDEGEDPARKDGGKRR